MGGVPRGNFKMSNPFSYKDFSIRLNRVVE